MIQEQREVNQLESELTLVVHSIIKKICHFNYDDIMRFLEIYENKTANNGATRLHNVAHFN